MEPDNVESQNKDLTNAVIRTNDHNVDPAASSNLTGAPVEYVGYSTDALPATPPVNSGSATTSCPPPPIDSLLSVTTSVLASPAATNAPTKKSRSRHRKYKPSLPPLIVDGRSANTARLNLLKAQLTTTISKVTRTSTKYDYISICIDMLEIAEQFAGMEKLSDSEDWEVAAVFAVARENLERKNGYFQKRKAYSVRRESDLWRAEAAGGTGGDVEDEKSEEWMWEGAEMVRAIDKAGEEGMYFEEANPET